LQVSLCLIFNAYFREGFKSFYQFCVPADLSVNNEASSVVAPYERKAVNVEDVCPASALLVDNTCFAAPDCPAKLPARCALLCVSDGSKCGEFTGKIISLLTTLITKFQANDLPGIVFAVKDVYDFVTSFPSCEAQAAAHVVTEIISIFSF
jgi:hypothetical protein